MMAEMRITSVDGIQDLLLHMEPNLVVVLVSLGPLETAPESYQTIRRLVVSRRWICNKLFVLEGLCWMALDLVNLREGLLPTILAQGANLNGPPHYVLHEFVCIKILGNQLLRAKTDIKFKGGEMIAQVSHLGTRLSGHADLVLTGAETVAQFQVGVPILIGVINNLLLVGMRF